MEIQSPECFFGEVIIESLSFSKRKGSMSITIRSSVENVDTKKWLCCKIHNEALGLEDYSLLGDVLEAYLNCTYQCICYDFSAVQVLYSRFFGVCFNLIHASKQKKIDLKFRFNTDTIDLAKVTHMDSCVAIETVSI